MQISNLRTFDLFRTCIASGYPMISSYNPKTVSHRCYELSNLTEEQFRMTPEFKRMVRLGKHPASSGHCNALSGLLVSFDVTATQAWWIQAERYHFLQIVSSMSKMHKLSSIIGDWRISRRRNATPIFHDAVKGSAMDALISALPESAGDPLNLEEAVYNCPMGLMLTARVTTNYLQLKNIIQQRHRHPLKEWRDFCEYMLNVLPYARDFGLEPPPPRSKDGADGKKGNEQQDKAQGQQQQEGQ